MHMSDHLQVVRGRVWANVWGWGWGRAGMASLAGCKCVQRIRFFLTLGAMNQGWAGGLT